MNIAHFRQLLKPWMLPIAMVCGVLFHNSIAAVQWLVPYLIFTMLFITFCKVKPHEFRVTSLSWSLLAIQLSGSIMLYLAIRPFSVDLSQAMFICVLCPTATAAPVVTGMLGGNVARLATFSIISNICTAIAAPLMFAFIGENQGISFLSTFMQIAAKVGPLIILPLILALVLNYAAPRVHKAVASVQSVSFYLWAVSLIVVVGRSVSFILSADASKIPEIILIALCSGVVCVLQFVAGRKIGRRCGDRIAGAQGLGQKNTVLAIWMALTFLNPISSIGPAAYVAWQNTINSWQLYRKTRNEAHGSLRHVASESN